MPFFPKAVIILVLGLCFFLSIFLFFPATGLLFHTAMSQQEFTVAGMGVNTVGALVAGGSFFYIWRQRVADNKKTKPFLQIIFAVVAMYFVICLNLGDFWLGLMRACSETC